LVDAEGKRGGEKSHCMRRRKAVESDRQRKGGHICHCVCLFGEIRGHFCLLLLSGFTGRSRRWTQKGLNEKDIDVLARVVLPEKAVMSHSICDDLERAEQSGSRELQLRVGDDTRRIRDISLVAGGCRAHHVSVTP